MKDLMPFTVSDAWVSTRPSTADGEDFGQEADEYFPELLAKDLDISSCVFSMRNMTSGSPEPWLSLENRGHTVAETLPRHAHATLKSQRSLDPIQERDSVVSFLKHCHQQQPHYNESLTDHESISGTDTSKGQRGPPRTMYDKSISTTATSLSSSMWSTSINCMPSREHSWIEPDSDEDGPDEVVEETISALSPRPPTPPEYDISNGAINGLSDNRAYGKLTRHKSRSVASSAASPPPITRYHSLRSNEIGNFSSSHISRHTYRSQGEPSFHAQQQQQYDVGLQSVRRQPRKYRSPQIDIQHDEWPLTAASEPFVEVDVQSDSEKLPNYKKPASSFAFTHPPPPSPPFPSVQSCLIHNGTAGIQLQGEELSRMIPLSTDVVETLRVSIACFPETMLLSSCLTIETIRSYSKKVRHPTAEPLANLHPDTPSSSPRKPFWKRVVTSKRSFTSQPIGFIGSQQLRSSSSSPHLCEPKPWAALKNVFGRCSDYICDALLAHIIAFNYISGIVPNTPARSLPSRGSTKSHPSLSNNEMSKEDIPKKAATLLGLTSSPSLDMCAAKSGVNSWPLKTNGIAAEQSARTTPYDNALKDIHYGLMKCIRRLIATARLMSEDSTRDDCIVEEEEREIDVLLIRSLCELVKMSEEATS